MRKIDTLKNALYQLVGENSALVEKIKVVNAKYPQIMEISISDDKTSSAWHDSNKIILGIKMLPQLYTICEKITNKFNITACMNIESKYSCYGDESIRGLLSVYNNEITCTPPSQIIESINFLNENCKNQKKEFTAVDTLVLYSIEYSICHEVGHLLYDNEIQNSIKKELRADEFAFQIAKNQYEVEMKNNTPIAYSRKIGTLLGVSSVLFYRKQNEENDDKGHPHTIERMYSMLNNWQIGHDSLLWEIGCYLIEKWTGNNGIPLPWKNDDNSSFRDKFMCVYSRIDKNHLYRV